MLADVVADLPPLEQERIVCSIQAASRYQIPANIMLAVAEKEGGKPNMRNRNSNGTYDLGTMQFNTSYLKSLKKHGIKEEYVLAAGCYPYHLAAWRLRMHLRNDKGDVYQRAANYHSYTPYYNRRYRVDLIKRSIKWTNWLKKHFETSDWGAK